jgi:hypothetical protein
MKKEKLKLFRIYTEEKNYDTVILPLLTTAFDGFSVYRGEGFWKSVSEKSLLIEVYTANKTLIRALAEKIRYANKQESVLITETECEVEFL